MVGLYLPMRWVVTTPDQSNDPNVFPFLSGQTFLALKGPKWATTVKQAASGRQVRSSLQSSPIWTFKVAYEYIRDRPPAQADIAALWAFYNQRQGQFGSFYYWDPYDNAVTGSQFGTGDGSTQTFQLSRIVSPSTAYAFIDPVYGVSGTPIVTVNGAATTAFTLGNFGQITFTAAPAASAVLAWSGMFMFYCHFTQDNLTPEQMVEGLWSLEDGLTFESLIP